MRSKYKLPFIGKTITNYLYANNKLNIKFNYYTKNRAINIIKPMLKFSFKIHNGFKYYKLHLKKKIKFLKVKLGELSFTRKKFKFISKKRRK